MALGGGTWTSQNKTLPGAYINFSSLASASAVLSDRGIATMPLELNWGPVDEVFEISAEDFYKNSMAYFGCAYTDDSLKGLRDLFKNATKLFAYRLNGNGGTKASCTFATAKYPGTIGNKLSIVVQTNVDNVEMFDCYTYLDKEEVDKQTVYSASDLVDNEYVDFDQDATIVLTASTPLSGGSDGTVSGSAYQDYIDKIESYSFNTMGVAVTDNVIKALFVAFCQRMRDERGIKFQLVLHDYEADNMGVINVDNDTEDDGWPASSAVYWVTGAQAGCLVNKSVQNKKYDGEFTINTDYTQSELSAAILAGKFVFHNVNGVVRVLDDINSLVTTTDTIGEIFKSNQSIRVIDQIANDVAVLFNTRYLGIVPNDADGRISLWNDICKLLQTLEDLRAIEDFDTSSVAVAQGDTKKSVVCNITELSIVNAMSKLYMSVIVA